MGVFATRQMIVGVFGARITFSVSLLSKRQKDKKTTEPARKRSFSREARKEKARFVPTARWSERSSESYQSKSPKKPEQLLLAKLKASREARRERSSGFLGHFLVFGVFGGFYS